MDGGTIVKTRFIPSGKAHAHLAINPLFRVCDWPHHAARGAPGDWSAIPIPMRVVCMQVEHASGEETAAEPCNPDGRKSTLPMDYPTCEPSRRVSLGGFAAAQGPQG